MSVAPAEPKLFAFDKPDGTPSPPLKRPPVMEAAERSLKVGDGAFSVVRGGQYHHPNLNRRDALKIVEESLKAVQIGKGVVARNAKGQQVFHAVRLQANPYDNMFRDVIGLWPERINGGVDYGCSKRSPVYALGNGIVINVGTPSNTATFGNDMMVLQLTDGPFMRHCYFLAEHYDTAPDLHDGMRVTTSTVIAYMTGSIEVGWSDGRGSIAWDIDNTIEGQRTVFGQNFSDLLVSVDCPPGLITGRPLTMTLPKDWPTAA